jgi:hypothetical protein
MPAWSPGPPPAAVAAAWAAAGNPLPLTTEDLDRIRSWFDCIQDTNTGFLEQADFHLADRLYRHLSIRVPSSIEKET